MNGDTRVGLFALSDIKAGKNQLRVLELRKEFQVLKSSKNPICPGIQNEVCKLLGIQKRLSRWYLAWSIFGGDGGMADYT